METFDDFISQVKQQEYRLEELTLDKHRVFTAVKETDLVFDVVLATEWENLVLHWGLGVKRPKEWTSPHTVPELELPANSVQFDEKATQTPFEQVNAGLARLHVIVPKSLSAKQLNFVLKQDSIWFNNDGRDYAVHFVVPQVGTLADEIVEAEVNESSWTLRHRFHMCTEVLKRISTCEEFAWTYVWMRYSELRYLDWQRNHNTQPRELSHTQQVLSYALTEVTQRASKADLSLILVRGIVAGIGRGGDQGQRIRDQILRIMRNNQMKKDFNFYEQWHQKLHNNTTPDDIGICEAVIAFNQTGDIGKYWEILDQHGITRERLASFDRPITVEPYYCPSSVADFQDYLGVLKSVHQSADLQMSIDHARGHLQGNALLAAVEQHLNHWDKIVQVERVVELRKALAHDLRAANLNRARELLYLDVSLESYSRGLVEQTIHLDLDLSLQTKQLFLMLDSVLLVYQTELLQACVVDTKAFSAEFQRDSSKEHALMFKSGIDRLYSVLGAFSDLFISIVDTKAKFLGTHFEVDEDYKAIFAEESLRGTLVLACSLLLKKIANRLRQLAGLKPWQVISPRSSTKGQLLAVNSLSEVAYTQYPEDTILLATKVTGDEEIPEGVVGVISCSDLDSLAHVSVRARNCKSLLVVCYEEAALASAHSLLGQFVEVRVRAGDIDIVATAKSNKEDAAASKRVIEIPKPDPFTKLIVHPEEFTSGNVGAKSRNCAVLRKSLGEAVPLSVSLPFGACEHFLNLPTNRSIFDALEDLANGEISNERLSQAQEVLMQLQASEDGKSDILAGLSAIGVQAEQWEDVWKAIKGVWASKYSERVFVSTRKAGIRMQDIVLSVLCQPIVTADYAYVLHTKNPLTENAAELYGEVVVGLGEVLVGAFEGKALAFTAHKTTGVTEILGFCSKTVALRNTGFIFRSDSNSEDLADFAGAGLFDSVPLSSNTETTPVYSKDPLVINSAFRTALLQKLLATGLAVEQCFAGEAQDIEGVIVSGEVYVVQSRPQV